MILILVETDENKVYFIDVKEQYKDIVIKCNGKNLQSPPNKNVDELFNLLGGEKGLILDGTLGPLIEELTKINDEIAWFVYD